MADLRTKLDDIADAVLKERPRKAATLVLINDEKQFTVIGLGDWRVADQKPFDLIRRGFTPVNKSQAGLCAE